MRHGLLANGLCAGLCALAPYGLVACGGGSSDSSSSTGGSGAKASGGSPGKGGASAGGVSTGGTSTGGTSAGGDSTGGTGASPANPDLDLASNEWRALTPKPSQRYVPGSGNDGLLDQSTPAGRPFGGIHYGDGKIFYFGGGHGAYPGNDVEIYDIAKGLWTQSYEPEVCDPADTTCNGLYGGWGVAALTPLGRPYTEHTEQKIAWDPIKKTFVANLTGATYSYDPVATTWTKIAPTLMGYDIYTWNILAFDPDLGAILGLVTTSGSSERGLYKLTSAGWQFLAKVPEELDYTQAYSAYMPDQHAYMVFQAGGASAGPAVIFWRLDGKTLAWTQITPAPSGWIDSFDYDTVHQVMIGVRHSPIGTFDVYAYTPGSDAWEQMPVTGSVPSQSGGLGAWSPMISYDPIDNVFIFVQSNSGAQSGPITTGPTVI